MLFVDKLIDLALEEDIGIGDITTECLVAPDTPGIGRIRAKEPLVLAGIDVAKKVFHRIQPKMRFISAYRDGDLIQPGEFILNLEGPMKSMLEGERTALNFLQRLSGIATHVRRYVDAIPEGGPRLVDTRKTTPGWRSLEKYAVRVGGALNHRFGLFDGVLIKDNHIAAAGGIVPAVEAIRARVHHLVKIEVEVESMSQVDEALAVNADVIMLDNMGLDEIRAAVSRIGGRALVEVSGSVTLEKLEALAGTGVDVISSGALTHQATSVDISMEIAARFESVDLSDAVMK